MKKTLLRKGAAALLDNYRSATIAALFLLLFSIGASAQWTRPNRSYGTQEYRRSIDSTLLFPTGCGTPTSTHSVMTGETKKAALYFDSCNHVFYTYDPSNSTWDSVSNSSTIAGMYVVNVTKNATADSFYVWYGDGSYVAYKDSVGANSFKQYVYNFYRPLTVTSNGVDTFDIRYTVTNITYSQLTTAISGSTLVPGAYYKLTDFATVYKVYGQADTKTGTTEPLILLATSTNTISSSVYSPSNPNDIIEYAVTDNSPLAPASGSKGVITYRKDAVNNLSSYYDWREVKWRRWALTAGTYYFAFSSGTPAISTDSSDVLTFASGNTDCSIGSNSWNIILGTNNSSVHIGSEVGSAGAGVDIGNSNHGITIDSKCANVATTGSGYIGGIWIGNNCTYINIGKRSYNIAIGSSCYAIDLGLQNNDVSIAPSTLRGRLEKGYSNFAVDVALSGKTIDLYNTNIYALPSFLYNSAQYCGIVNVTSGNAVDTLDKISAITTSIAYSDIQIRPEAGLNLLIRDKGSATTSGANFHNNGSNILVNGDSVQYVQVHKNILNTLGSQTSDFLLSYTNVPVSGGGGTAIPTDEIAYGDGSSVTSDVNFKRLLSGNIGVNLTGDEEGYYAVSNSTNAVAIMAITGGQPRLELNREDGSVPFIVDAATGNVGINAGTTPTKKLDVDVVTDAAGIKSTTYPDGLFYIGDNGDWGIGDLAPAVNGTYIFGADAAGTIESQAINGWTHTGNLTLTGQFKLVDGTQSAGYVLTSDADGLASWQAPSGGGWADTLSTTALTAGTKDVYVPKSLAVGAGIPIGGGYGATFATGGKVVFTDNGVNDVFNCDGLTANLLMGDNEGVYNGVTYSLNQTTGHTFTGNLSVTGTITAQANAGALNVATYVADNAVSGTTGLFADPGNDYQIAAWDGTGFVYGTNGIKINTGNVVTISDLAGIGTRAVLADAGGVLSAPVSDFSVKQFIQPLDYGLNTIMKLKPVSFEYKDGWKNYGQGKQIGFIAQDIQQVLPNSAFTTPKTGKMGYNEIDLIPVLVSAMQQQQKQIEALKLEIENLKHK